MNENGRLSHEIEDIVRRETGLTQAGELFILLVKSLEMNGLTFQPLPKKKFIEPNNKDRSDVKQLVINLKTYDPHIKLIHTIRKKIESISWTFIFPSQPDNFLFKPMIKKFWSEFPDLENNLRYFPKELKKFNPEKTADQIVCSLEYHQTLKKATETFLKSELGMLEDVLPNADRPFKVSFPGNI